VLMTDTDPNCLFCKIVAGQVPSTKVYEDDQVYAFKDINPKAKIHVLIVPKNHYASVAELASKSPDTLAHIVEVAQRIANDEADGSYRLIFNTGKNAGQSVFHVHAHVLTGEVLPE
jgi:histidine triad (HIT) family protein